MCFYRQITGKHADSCSQACSCNALQAKCGTSRKRWLSVAVIIPSLLVALLSRAVSAQPIPTVADDERPSEATMSEWRMQSFASEAGLTSQGVNDICFETNGNAWVATSDGLYYYDGYAWTNYSVNAGFPSPFVRSLLLTRSGKLWVGTDKGAGVFDGRQFDYNGADKGLAGPSVVSIAEDPDGTIWFCSDTWPDASVPSGLTSLSTNGLWTIFRKADGLPSDHIFNYFRSSKGDQFAMTSEGVAMRDGHGWLPVQGLLGASEKSPAPNRMAELPSIGPVCFFRGSLMNYQHGKWNTNSDNITTLQDIPGFGPVFLPWMVSRKGEILKVSSVGNGPLRICRLNGRKFDPISPPITRPSIIDSLVEAPDGAIWCLGPGLLTRWDRYGGEWKEFINLPPPVSLNNAGEVVFSDGKSTYNLRGNVFVTTNDHQEVDSVCHDGKGGWKIVNQEVWRIQDGNAIEKTDIKPSGIQQAKLLIQDCKDLLWLVGQDISGNTRIAIHTGGAWKPIDIPDLLESKLMRRDGRTEEGDFISSALTPDPNGGIWLAVVAPNRPNVLIYHVSLTNVIAYPINYPRMGSLAVAPDGHVFVFGTGGTFSLDKSLARWQPVAELAGRLVRSAVQRRQELWCLSDAYAGGKNSICLYIAGNWTHYILPVSGFLGKLTDGTIYFAGKNCLYYVTPNSVGLPQKLTMLEGQQPDAVIRDKQGRLWIAVSGMEADQVLCYSKNDVPPRTFISEAPVSVRSDALFRPVVTVVDRFVVRGQERSFNYSWRFDRNSWTTFQELPVHGLPVSGLPLGYHTFQIRSQSEDGDIDPTPAEADFVVLAIPLQERPWFKPSIIIVGIIICGLSILVTGLARRTATLFADLFDNAPIPYHELDIENRVCRVNNTELKMLGYSREEMLGRSFDNFIAEEEVKKFVAEKKSRTRTTRANEWNLRRKDGTLLPVLMEDRLIKRRGGSIICIRSTLQDITSQKQTELKLLRMHDELSEAHTHLKELNEQLKTNVGVQIIARQQAETEFVLISTERNRVARELHDTLEQSLAGIALRMDAIKELITTNPEMAQHQLETASEVLRQSQMEVRRTVWGLRALALEQSNLVMAVKTMAAQITESTAIKVLVETVGEITTIPESAENHLLRICQEAIGNALKHGRARVVTVRLAFDNKRTLIMTIHDDGCGFALSNVDSIREQHYGLLGMRERVRDIRGQLKVQSVPGAGTTIEVNVVLDNKKAT